MKYVIQKETGLGETSVVELDEIVPDEIALAYAELDKRLWATNAKIVEVREFVSQIKDPNYRYLFVSFFDTLMGISSQAEPLARKMKVEAPGDFDAWMNRQSRGLEVKK